MWHKVTNNENPSQFWKCKFHRQGCLVKLRDTKLLLSEMRIVYLAKTHTNHPENPATFGIKQCVKQKIETFFERNITAPSHILRLLRLESDTNIIDNIPTYPQLQNYLKTLRINKFGKNTKIQLLGSTTKPHHQKKNKIF